MDKDKMDELNRICVEASKQQINDFFEYLAYERKVLTGEVPMPEPAPIKPPIIYREED